MKYTIHRVITLNLTEKTDHNRYRNNEILQCCFSANVRESHWITGWCSNRRMHFRWWV